MLPRVIVIGISTCLVFVVSGRAYLKEKTLPALAQLIGAGFLLVVIFAHASEALGLLPSMGWGKPDSIGHYIDLTSAVVGAILLPLGYLGRRFTRPSAS